MLVLKPFLRRSAGAQRQNRTADTGIFNRPQSSGNAERSATSEQGSGLYVGGPEKIGVSRSTLSRRWSESAVPDVVPSWLKDAKHYVPPWAESVLYALHGAGFRFPGGEP